MKKHIKIGENEYQSKKEAIAHYRQILNSYDFGQSLNDADFFDLLDLLNYSPNSENEPSKNEPSGNEPSENTIYVADIKVSKVQFNTKCFEVFDDDGDSHYISYLLCINRKSYSPMQMFSIACRNAVNADIHHLKSLYFKDSKKGMVKCQETGILSKWEELVVDHRQPNTFSVIVDRFKELNNIDLDNIEYTSDDKNNIVFLDSSLSEKFRQYHNAKANLRVVRRECNASRIGMAKVKRTNKDLIIPPPGSDRPGEILNLFNS
jgi:hypothetical protein